MQQSPPNLMVNGKGDYLETFFFQSEGWEKKKYFFKNFLAALVWNLEKKMLKTRHQGRIIFVSDAQELMYDRSENWSGEVDLQKRICVNISFSPGMDIGAKKLYL